jgi:hypothetical protein
MYCKRVAVIGCLAVVRQCAAQNPSSYAVSVDGISVADVATGMRDIAAIHIDRPFNVIANLKWEDDFYDVASTNQISWEMYVNDVVEATGVLDLVEVRSLPVPHYLAEIGAPFMHHIITVIMLNWILCSLSLALFSSSYIGCWFDFPQKRGYV